MRIGLRITFAALLWMTATLQPASAAGAPANPALADTLDAAERSRLAEQVKAEFLHAWNGYVTHAWGHDDLKPLSRTGSDWYGESLLMTPVDAFSTMKLMQLDGPAARAKQVILDDLSFDRDLDVQVFEVTIRLLGGLLSAYQLDGDDGFLDLATELGDRLLPAFGSPTGMPYRYVNLRTGAVSDPASNSAEIGTLLLEFGTLSEHTGDPVYYETAKKAVEVLFGKRSAIDLVGTVIDVETGEWLDTESHASARIDSYYEYLLKGWRMFGDADLHRM